jgi:hypothetical protein
VRGGMYWHKGPPSAPEAAYLVRTSPSGAEKSLGPRTPETELIHDRFHERKRISTERMAGLKAALEDHRRMNKALRVGRVDPLIIDLLNRLAASKLGEHFRVVGTHTLYAYEAAASITFDAGAVATRDIDLLWDTRKRIQFATQLTKIDSSMLGVLKKVDPSFRVRNSQKYTAVNKDGFEVDIIRREPVDGDPHPVRRGADEDDFWVAQAPNAHILLDSPPFSAVIVASNGDMARMNTLHPLAFAKFKRWMSELPNREPPKRGRDALQAQVVEEVVKRYLPHLASGVSLPEIPQARVGSIGVTTGLPAT